MTFAYAAPAFGPALTVMAPEPKGLALVLELARDNAGLSLAAAAAMAAAASSPLLAHSFRSKGGAVVSKFTAAAAVPAVAYSLQPRYFSAKAASPPAARKAAAPDSSMEEALTELKPVWALFWPQNLLKMLGKNLGIQFIMQFNKYMVTTLEHEKQVIDAEQQGLAPPEAPPLPDMSPVLDKGFASFCREVLVATTRRIYEHIAVWRLSARKAQALLRDGKAWIRDILSVRHAGAPVAVRFTKYQFATLHAVALFYAADCTVAVGYHTLRTLRRKGRGPQDKALYWAKGAGAHVARVAVTMVAVSVGAALGSLVKPGIGTTIGQMSVDALSTMGCSIVIDALLAD